MSTPGQIIPVLIVCFNNHLYVENTIRQLKRFNLNLIIMDNASTSPKTVEYLKNSTVPVIWNKTNDGPWVNEECNIEVYNQMPQKFIITDPDLEYNPNLPLNFVDIMIDLATKYETHKFGLGLDISDFDKMYNEPYSDGRTIYDTEIGHWGWRVDIGEDASKYEMYFTGTDTTFHVVDKIGYHVTVRNIRIAGDFTARHIPWYRKNSLLNLYDTYMSYKNTERISTMARIVVPDIESKYLRIEKNNELFLIENTEVDQNIKFWREKYTQWENERFAIIDAHLTPSKVFIDIGGWIGGTGMYGSRKSKRVIVVEADSKSVVDLTKNCELNCTNVDIVAKAVFSSEGTVLFGRNWFWGNSSEVNDSMSQIHTSYDPEYKCECVPTITVAGILKDYGVAPSDISLINVDIEGGEENILTDLFQLYTDHGVPLYISFHHSWWKDKNLDRFEFLTEEHKRAILADPFHSILFSK